MKRILTMVLVFCFATTVVAKETQVVLRMPKTQALLNMTEVGVQFEVPDNKTKDFALFFVKNGNTTNFCKDVQNASAKLVFASDEDNLQKEVGMVWMLFVDAFAKGLFQDEYADHANKRHPGALSFVDAFFAYGMRMKFSVHAKQDMRLLVVFSLVDTTLRVTLDEPHTALVDAVFVNVQDVVRVAELIENLSYIDEEHQQQSVVELRSVMAQLTEEGKVAVSPQQWRDFLANFTTNDGG